MRRLPIFVWVGVAVFVGDGAVGMEVDGFDIFFDGDGVFVVAFAGEELFYAIDRDVGDFEVGVAFGDVGDGLVEVVPFDRNSALADGVDVDGVCGNGSRLRW